MRRKKSFKDYLTTDQKIKFLILIFMSFLILNILFMVVGSVINHNEKIKKEREDVEYKQPVATNEVSYIVEKIYEPYEERTFIKNNQSFFIWDNADYVVRIREWDDNLKKEVIKRYYVHKSIYDSLKEGMVFNVSLNKYYLYEYDYNNEFESFENYYKRLKKEQELNRK